MICLLINISVKDKKIQNIHLFIYLKKNRARYFPTSSSEYGWKACPNVHKALYLAQTRLVLYIESNTSIEQEQLRTTLLVCLSVERNTALQLLGFSRA